MKRNPKRSKFKTQVDVLVETNVLFSGEKIKSIKKSTKRKSALGRVLYFVSNRKCESDREM